jgi:hypothetical protein
MNRHSSIIIISIIIIIPVLILCLYFITNGSTATEAKGKAANIVFLFLVLSYIAYSIIYKIKNKKISRSKKDD